MIGMLLSPIRRRVLFRLLAITLSVLPLVLLELGLRAWDETAVEAIDETPLVNLAGLKPLFKLDDSTAGPAHWRIPKSRMNFFRPASFLADKPTGGKRIFVLGGSTAQGRPYAVETAFSTWLELRLKATSPGTPIEVVNCGGVSYASYRVKKILDEVLTHEPDAIVLYTGHNEFLESRSYAAVRELSPGRRWLATVASELAIVRMLNRWRPMGPSPTPFTTVTMMAEEVDARLDHADGLAAYHRDDDWRSSVERHFASTLREIVVACEDAEVPLLVCVPACDWVNSPPFKIESPLSISRDDSKRLDDAWAVATGASDSIDRRRRASACRECLSIDPHHAGANYLLGRWAYDEGDANRARPLLQAAIDRDVCPLRMTTPILESTRKLIDEFELPHVDVERLLDEHSARGLPYPDAIPDPDRFVDHVHPTIESHQLIAQSLATELERLGWPSADEAAQGRYQASSQQHLLSLTEAYYGRGKQRLAGLKNWAAGRAANLGIFNESLPQQSELSTGNASRQGP